MRRFTALLCVLAATAAVAAPAPRPKAGPWFTGWDKPIDPQRDCTFDRKGDKLTITVPGKGHVLGYVREGTGYELPATSTAPRLMRDVEGDFAVQVRVNGSVDKMADKGNMYRAGLIVLDGTKSVKWILYYPAVGKRPRYYRIERRGEVVTTLSSEDGERWETRNSVVRPKLPKKLQVGVAAEVHADGVFKAEFDRFKLTPLAGPGR